MCCGVVVVVLFVVVVLRMRLISCTGVYKTLLYAMWRLIVPLYVAIVFFFSCFTGGRHAIFFCVPHCHTCALVQRHTRFRISCCLFS